MRSDTRPPDRDPRSGDPEPLGGRPRSIRFPPFWHAWFARQTEQRLAALDELVDARIERRVMRRFFGRLKHAVVVAFLAAAAGAHWFSDQVAWVVERLPVLERAWHAIVGGG